jgi:hypothetical protein
MAGVDLFTVKEILGHRDIAPPCVIAISLLASFKKPLIEEA